MKIKTLLLSFAIVLLLVDLLALEDITTGNESSLLGEYLIVFASVPILAVVGYYLFRKVKL